MMQPLLNHLWQSTLFAIAAGLLTLAFRRNRAHVRYWLWFSASIKFLIPMAWLITLGGLIQWMRPVKTAPIPAVSITVIQVAEPFGEPAAWSVGAFRPAPWDWAMTALCAIWFVGFAAIVVTRFRMWRRLQGFLTASTSVEIRAVAIPESIEVRAVGGLMEPGVIGWLRPVLLFPSDIASRLSPQELKAIVAHEMAHIRRRDNLMSAIHMIVEALFWFHPLVWWIGARLIDERERACDEEVLRSGNEPIVYAEGMLKVCKTYLASPLRCVSGVTGSSLKKRLRIILVGSLALDLNLAKKLLLAAAASCVVAVSLSVGIIRAQSQAASLQDPRLRFDVASIRPRGPDQSGHIPLRLPFGSECNGDVPQVSPSRIALNGNFYTLLVMAYGLDCVSADGTALVTGGPGWVKTDLWTLQAVIPEADGLQVSPEKCRSVCRAWIRDARVQRMLQNLLAERFKLVVHWETKEVPVYALTVANGGPKLQHPEGPACSLPGDSNNPGQNVTPPKPGCTLGLRNGSMADFAASIVSLDRPVVDRTAITGTYEFRLVFDPRRDLISTLGTEPTGQSVFTALQQQLGLKLESAKAPADILVIDSVEKPSEN